MTYPLEHAPQSMVMVRIGGHDYPLRTVATCQVCQSPYRFEVERALVHGSGYTAVHTAFTGRTPEPPPVDAMIAHVSRGHLPLPLATSRIMLEQRARALGKDIEEGLENLVDHAVVNEEIIRKGYQRLQDGDIEPSMGDLLKAMEFQAKLDAATPSGDLTTEAWQEALMEYFEIARRMMPPEMWARFGQELAQSPILKAIASQQAAVQGEVMGE
jgi:hypothetical protein